MLGRIALFELRYQLRRPIALISFIVFAALAVGLQSVIALAGGALFVNAPSVIAQQLGIFSIVAMFLSLAVLADVALRDAATRMDPIMRSMPVRAGWYFGARFVGAYAVACLGFLGVVLGNSLAAVMPWIPASAVGPFRPAAYIVALAVIALPNFLVTGALFFSIAMFTRSLLATYLAALAFFIAYIGAQMLVASPDHRVLAALLDPFGVVALRSDIAYWTLLERNTWSIPLSGLLLWNRLVWIGIGLALLALSLTLFSARDRRPRSADVELAKAASSPIMRERPALAAGGAGAWDQFLVRTRYETGTILRSWTFFVLLALSVLASIGALLVRNYFVAMPSMPVTYVVVDIVAVAFAFVALLVPIAYGGELLWRERAVKIAEIIDATPTPTAVFFLAKLVAVALVLLLLLVVIMAAGIAFQLANGITDIDFGFYLVKMLLMAGLPALMFAVLAMLIQTVVNQKFIGLLIALAVVLAAAFAPGIGIDSYLLRLFELPEVPLSDLNRYGHYLARALWFAAYWTCVTVLVGVATYLIWLRGTGSLWTRVKRAHLAITPAVASVAGVALAGTAASAGYIYWNTRILNEYAGTSARERLQVAYEAAYRNSEALPQPRITEIDMEIDLYPDRRAFRSRGRYTLVNRADVPIETVLVMFGMDRIDQVELQGADVAARQPRFNLVEFRARTPIAPGQTRTLTFTTSDTRRGFEEGSDGSPVLYNGTFAHSPYLAPSIGVQREHYLQSDARRRAYGLEPLPGMAARDDKAQRRRNFINADADFIRFSATVSTSADQIALAPGNLEREWSEGGRKFFRYSTDRPILNFWSVVSGRYVVARDQWNGVELAVHHHPKHGRNVPRMLDAMKQALTYYTTQFGPYPHRQLRIAEFPRYAAPLVAAQSFPAMIPYSEDGGFIADLAAPGSVDYVWHITAHEVGHQWWPHQVAGAAVEGAQFLSESLSEYSALMVAEHRYGAHRMRQYLKYELDTYLRQRGEFEERAAARPRRHGPDIRPLPEGRARALCPQGRGRRNGREPRARALPARTRLQDGPLSDLARVSAAVARRGGARARPAHHRPVREDHALGPARRRRGGGCGR